MSYLKGRNGYVVVMYCNVGGLCALVVVVSCVTL
jgi:hypothetical protein